MIKIPDEIVKKLTSREMVKRRLCIMKEKDTDDYWVPIRFSRENKRLDVVFHDEEPDNEALTRAVYNWNIKKHPLVFGIEETPEEEKN